MIHVFELANTDFLKHRYPYSQSALKIHDFRFPKT